MILTNPEGRKESEETIIQTDEDGMLIFHYFQKEELYNKNYIIAYNVFRVPRTELDSQIC